MLYVYQINFLSDDWLIDWLIDWSSLNKLALVFDDMDIHKLCRGLCPWKKYNILFGDLHVNELGSFAMERLISNYPY